jgi:hypothetical protein
MVERITINLFMFWAAEKRRGRAISEEALVRTSVSFQTVSIVEVFGGAQERSYRRWCNGWETVTKER